MAQLWGALAAPGDGAGGLGEPVRFLSISDQFVIGFRLIVVYFVAQDGEEELLHRYVVNAGVYSPTVV